jgi:hypothetical protein
MSIYQELIAAGIPIANHESDLYAKVTPESKAILGKYEHKGNLSTFLNQVEGGLWYEIPFAFDPFWRSHQASRDGKEAVWEKVSKRASANTENLLIDLVRAVLLWAKTPGNHGGNPYRKEFVRQAQKAAEHLRIAV